MATKTTKPTQAKVASMLSHADAEAVVAKTALTAIAWALTEAGIDGEAVTKAIKAVNELTTVVRIETAKAGIGF